MMNANDLDSNRPMSTLTPTSGDPSPRVLRRGVVVANESLCREHWLLRIRVEGAFPPSTPGQFIQLGCRAPEAMLGDEALDDRELEWTPGQRLELAGRDAGEPMCLLRRPFSLAGRRDGPEGAELEVIHRVVGVGTQWLADRAVGDSVDFIGPLGRGFTFPGRPDAERGLALLIGGGVGLPPMLYLAEAAKAAGWDAVAVVGALSEDLLAVRRVGPGHREGEPTHCVEPFASLGYPTVVTTDDGSEGLRGRITDGLDRLLKAMSARDRARTVAYVCGPTPMMRAAAVHGVTPAGRPWRYRLTCTEGPVFDARDVVWG